MPGSLSPSIGSTTLTYDRRPPVISSSMRLPSFSEMMRFGQSDRDRTSGQFDSQPSNTPKSRDGFIDLTTDSSISPYHRSTLFGHFPPSNPTFTSHPIDSAHLDLDIFDMAPSRRTRGSSDVAIPPPKRRRVDRLPTAQSPITLSSSPPPPRPGRAIPIPDNEPEPKRSNLKRRASSELQAKREQGDEVVEPKNEQDKQLADTIKAQAGQPAGNPKLNQLTCIICMDDMTDMTATICGHVFCHTCIMEALIAGESQPDGRPMPKCPMCRTKLRRNHKGPQDIVPLTLKHKRKSDKAKGKQREIL